MKHHRTTQQETLGRALRKAVISSGVMVAAMAAGVGVATIAVDTGLLPSVGVVDQVSPESSGEANGSTPEQLRYERAGVLVDAHGCWSSGAEMPADMRGEYPGHVVVTVPPTNGKPDPWPTYSADLVDPALEQVFGSDPMPGLVVHAFCR